MLHSESLKTSILGSFSTHLQRNKGLASADRASAEALFSELLTTIEPNNFNTSKVSLKATQELAGRLGLSRTAAESAVVDYLTNNPLSQAELLLVGYLLALKRENCSQSTIKNYRSDIGQFISFSSESLISKLFAKPKVLAFLRNERAKGLTKSSIKRKLVSITQFGIWMELESILPARSLTWLLELNETFEGAFTASQAYDNANTKRNNVEHNTKDQSISKARTPFVFTKSVKAASPQDRVPSESGILTSPLKRQEQRYQFKRRLYDLRSKVLSGPQKQLLPYLNLLMSLILFLGMGYFGYLQVFGEVEQPLAYPTALTRPNRTLSFQGRLTDTAQNPIISSTNLRFRLYDSGPSTSGGNLLWDSNTCSVTPDQDGIFSVGLGEDCGAEIGSEVFSENSNVWLQVQVASEILSPRQSIKSVAYALNAETLQGFPPADTTTGATNNTVLVMNNSGQVILGQNNPKLDATSGTFTIEAQTLTLQTGSGSNGDINIDPDGTGKLNLLSDVNATGYIRAPGATLSATYAGGTALTLNAGPSATADIMRWQNSSGTTLGVIDESGNVGIGTSGPTAKFHTIGNASIFQQETDNSEIVLFKEYRGGNLGRMYESGDAGVFEVGYYGLAGPRAVLNGGTSNGAETKPVRSPGHRAAQRINPAPATSPRSKPRSRR